jgi:hypothetical protein
MFKSNEFWRIVLFAIAAGVAFGVYELALWEDTWGTNVLAASTLCGVGMGGGAVIAGAFPSNGLARIARIGPESSGPIRAITLPTAHGHRRERTVRIGEETTRRSPN